MLTIYQLVNFAGPSTDLSHGDRARLEGSTPRRQSLWPDSSLAWNDGFLIEAIYES